MTLALTIWIATYVTLMTGSVVAAAACTTYATAEIVVPDYVSLANDHTTRVTTASRWTHAFHLEHFGMRTEIFVTGAVYWRFCFSRSGHRIR